MKIPPGDEDAVSEVMLRASVGREEAYMIVLEIRSRSELSDIEDAGWILADLRKEAQ